MRKTAKVPHRGHRKLILAPMFVSLTRLRIRSFFFLPLFFFHAFRAIEQIRKAPGFQIGELLSDRDRTYWTMTAWNNEQAMRVYMTTGSHKAAMRYLMHWCDEASVAHWPQQENTLPSWTEADLRMRQTGRPSKVLHPSPRHATLTYNDPSRTSGQPIRPR